MHICIFIRKDCCLPCFGWAAFASILGFAHEEKFVILAFATGDAGPLLLMTSYTTSVMASLIGITMLAAKVYTYVERIVILYTRYFPEISASMLAAVARVCT